MVNDRSTKERVYLLLAAGKSQSQVATIVDRDKTTVNHHARDLERRGFLRRVADDTTPILYERGPFAPVFEREHELEGVVEGVPSAAGDRPTGVPPQDSARIHGESHKVTVVEPPSEEVAWDKEWEANGVVNRRLVTEVDGVAVRLWLIESSGGTDTLMVQVRPQWTSDPEMLEDAPERRREAARGAAVWFAREHGAVLQGEVEAVTETQVGFELPEDVSVEDVGEDPEGTVWVDESPGPDRTEVETSDASVASSIASLPDWRAELREWREDLDEWREMVTAKLDLLAEEGEATRDALAKLVEIEKDNAEIRRLLTEALLQDDDDGDGDAVTEPEPPDDPDGRDPGIV